MKDPTKGKDRDRAESADRTTLEIESDNDSTEAQCAESDNDFTEAQYAETEIVSRVPFFNPAPTGQSAINQLLYFIARGEQNQAQLMVQTNPRLLLQYGEVTDLSGRDFVHITGFQYACWALDWHMWAMLRGYMTNEVVTEQVRELLQNGTQHGVSAEPILQELIDALDKYVKKYPSWNRKERDGHRPEEDVRAAFWHNDVGPLQRCQPIHVLNEYCHPTRSFKPTPDFTAAPLPRSRVCYNALGVHKQLHSDDRHGRKFALIRSGASSCAELSPGRLWPECDTVQNDLSALLELRETRVDQLESLQLDLGLASVRDDEPLPAARPETGDVSEWECVLS